ncbi:MAG: DNA polymerase Y family protein, partial [Burkholderiales bacterium]|nr:DNA polymerase Y family protein [Burkholderiales bacterium]
TRPAQGRAAAGRLVPGPAAGRVAQAAAPALPAHRPVWLLPEPLPLAERDELPQLEGQPLQLVSGPERIETGWWDGEPALRDYYIAQAADGSLVWVYRTRLPAPAGDGPWFLQGRFG